MTAWWRPASWMNTASRRMVPLEKHRQDVRLFLLRPRPRAAGADHLRDALAAGALIYEPHQTWWCLGCLVWGLAILPASAGLKNSDCLDCHGDNTLFKTNSAGKAISLFVDAAKFKLSAHGTNTCISCHADITAKHPDDNQPVAPVNCAVCHARQTESFNASVHGLALKAGHDDAATCQDCHDSHEMVSERLADLADLFFAAGGNLRRLPRQGGARLGAKRPRQGRPGRFARRADLHRLPRRT